MNDHARAIQTFALASANLDFASYASLYPRWWFIVFYSTPARDLAALAAIAAESGETQLAIGLIERLRGTHLNIAHLDTQEKAWLLRAAHALNKEGGPAGVTINGEDRTTLSLPLALAPSLAEIASGYEVANRGSRNLWRTLVIRGVPRLAPSAMRQAMTIIARCWSTAACRLGNRSADHA
jgi:alpha-2-macroglobulin